VEYAFISKTEHDASELEFGRVAARPSTFCALNFESVPKHVHGDEWGPIVSEIKVGHEGVVIVEREVVEYQAAEGAHGTTVARVNDGRRVRTDHSLISVLERWREVNKKQ